MPVISIRSCLLLQVKLLDVKVCNNEEETRLLSKREKQGPSKIELRRGPALDVQVDHLDGPVYSQKGSEDVTKIDGHESLNRLSSNL